MNSKRMACLFGITLLATGCGGGGGGGSAGGGGGDNTVTLSSLVEGIEVPSKISAVPADNSDQTNSKTSYQAGSFSAAIRSILAAATTSQLSTSSDYALAEPSVYVEERALEQFDIIEQVFSALAQTNYAKEENVNKGPYKAMIAWKEEQNGKDVKSLQTWTVESQMIVKTLPSDVTGNTTGDVNRLLAWIPETDRETGQEQVVKAEFIIYTAPTKSTDGSLVNYGEWDMNVLMRASTTGVDTVPAGGPMQFFVASARIGSGGVSVLKVHDGFQESFGGMSPVSAEMKGILYRNGTSGYGQVSYPDWDACWQFDPLAGGTPPCQNGVPNNLAKYAYNANYLGVQQTFGSGTPETAIYKDRTISGAIRLVHRYDLFYANADTNTGVAEGDNVAKHVNFGFPVSFEQTSTDGNLNTFNDFGFYGAWQGRHQLWVGGSFTPTGGSATATVFTRQDVAPGQTAPTYNVREFGGTFTKRALISANLDDIKNVAVETWLNDNYDLIYFDPDATGPLPADWQYCTGYIDWALFDPKATNPAAPICRDKANTDNNTNEIAFVPLFGVDGNPGTGDDSELLGQLSVSSGERRNVNINRCDQTGCTDYMYLKTDPTDVSVTWTGAGFYAAEWGMEGQSPVSGASKLVGAAGSQMWINIGGSIYVAYDGDFSGSKTGWVQKTLTSFDQNTWTPTFDANGDSAFTPERGYQYYMNANGQNYVVTRTDADATSGFQVGDFAAKLELQTAANPANTNLSISKSVLPAGTAYLASPWDNAVKYTLVDDPNDASGNYLLLVVRHDSTGSSVANSPATSGVWGLVAYADGGSNNDYTNGTGFIDDGPIASDGSVLVVDEWGWVDPSQNGGQEPMQFNWEYADDQNPWGKQQFLVYASNAPSGSSIGDYVILSDQINLVQVGLYDNLGNPVKANPAGSNVTVGGDESNWKKVNLRFDGWLYGLPDMYNELRNNSWQFTPEMAGNIRRLKEGQKVSDGTLEYFIKPMDTSLFLGVVNAFPQAPGQPDISAASNADLTTVPDYVHHQMGAAPTTKDDGSAVVIKYSEGQPIE